MHERQQLDLLTSDAVSRHKVTFIPEELEPAEFSGLQICTLIQQIVAEKLSPVRYLCLI